MSEYTPTRQEMIAAWIWAHSTEGWSGPVDLGGEPKTRIAEAHKGIAEVERAAAEEALTEVRSTIGAYQEHGVWAFDQAVKCIERSRAAAIKLTAGQEGESV